MNNAERKKFLDEHTKSGIRHLENLRNAGYISDQEFEEMKREKIRKHQDTTDQIPWMLASLGEPYELGGLISGKLGFSPGVAGIGQKIERMAGNVVYGDRVVGYNNQRLTAIHDIANRLLNIDLADIARDWTQNSKPIKTVALGLRRGHILGMAKSVREFTSGLPNFVLNAPADADSEVGLKQRLYQLEAIYEAAEVADREATGTSTCQQQVRSIVEAHPLYTRINSFKWKQPILVPTQEPLFQDISQPIDTAPDVYEGILKSKGGQQFIEYIAGTTYDRIEKVLIDTNSIGEFSLSEGLTV